MPSPPQVVPTPTTNDSPVKLPPIYDSSSHSKSSPPAPITSHQSASSSSSESSSNQTAIIVGASVDPFYNGTTEWSNNRQSVDHVVGIPPPQTSVNYSSEYNSGNSGQHPQTHSPMGGLGSSQCQFSYEELA
ncbi:hypothetical protein Leryth_018255 [Lithospermum erythrorhizon]|nr:hypothetical protein Leryth_018255 [Lithospermum erythrorhizon]